MPHNLNKPTVSFRREPGASVHELFAECRRTLLAARNVADAKAVDGLISIIKPDNWRDGVKAAQEYCIVNVIQVTPAKESPADTQPTV